MSDGELFLAVAEGAEQTGQQLTAVSADTGDMESPVMTAVLWLFSGMTVISVFVIRKHRAKKQIR